MFGNKEWLKMTTSTKNKDFFDVKKLPIYHDKMNQKVLSPLSTIKHDFSTIEAYPEKSIYVQLTDTKGQVRNKVVDSIKENPPK